MNRFVESARRVPLGWYLGIAFAFTWALLPLAANSIPVSLVALCGPAVAALLVTAAMPATERLAFRSRLTDWRLPIRWYLLALALPWPVTLLRSGLEYAWAGGRVELMPITPLGLAVFVLVAGEETGWRGFALPRLLPRFGAWRASVILGVVWAFWHLPLFFTRGMPQFGTPFPAFVAYTVALSVVLTYLARKTRGSVVIATLFHGAVNTFGWVNPDADPALRGWLNALCYGLVALPLGLVAWGRRSTNQEAP
jgi:membrane protease YdiL (CAAX protease family)